MGVQITNERAWHPAYLVWASALERLWPRNSLYVGEWIGEPKKNWFHPVNNKFRTSDLGIYTNENGSFIHFTNGRHRTRWLIQSGAEVIPVGVNENDISLASEIGLLVRKVTEFDKISYCLPTTE